MRALITGASGSGTSTLARSVAGRLRIAAFDADDYFWLPTSPPFVSKREPQERLAMILRDLGAAGNCVLGGSIVDWGAQLGCADPAFLDWAAQYDEGRLEGRSRAKHERWLAARRCPVLSDRRCI
jgi:hypothetical protein